MPLLGKLGIAGLFVLIGILLLQKFVFQRDERQEMLARFKSDPATMGAIQLYRGVETKEFDGDLRGRAAVFECHVSSRYWRPEGGGSSMDGPITVSSVYSGLPRNLQARQEDEVITYFLVYKSMVHHGGDVRSVVEVQTYNKTTGKKIGKPRREVKKHAADWRAGVMMWYRTPDDFYFVGTEGFRSTSSYGLDSKIKKWIESMPSVSGPLPTRKRAGGMQNARTGEQRPQ